MDRTIHLSTNCRDDIFENGMDFFDKSVFSGGNKQMKLRLAYEEVFANILRENEDGSLDIYISIRAEKDFVDIVIKDNGMQFDPLAVKDPDIMLGLDERPIGGLGIYLFKKYTDRAAYKYEDGYNILSFGIDTSDV